MSTIFSSNKILRHLGHLQDYLCGGFRFPITMEFDLTDKCDHACPRCAGGRTGAELTWEEARDYLSQLADCHVKAVTFTGGGEPCLHPHLVDALCHAHSLGMDVGLITNGTSMTRQIADAAVCTCVWVRVSLDANGPLAYRQTHGRDGDFYQRACDAIRMLSASRDTLHSGCTVGVGYLVDRNTRPDMMQATMEVRDYGADYIQFRPFHYQTTPIEDQLLVCKRLETERFKVLASQQKYACAGVPQTYKKCHGSYFCGVIQADANLAYCCHFRGRPEYSLGSLREQSFADLWHSPRRCEVELMIDVTQCIPLCRLDAINRFIEDAATPKEHENFL